MESNGVDLKVLCLIVFSVACSVVGQIFFKTGAKSVGPLELNPSVVALFLRPTFFLGLCCYGMAATSWLVVLTRIPLSLAYPLASISYLLVVLAGRFYFHETVSLHTWGGLALICLGVCLIGLGNPSGRAPAPPSTPPMSTPSPSR